MYRLIRDNNKKLMAVFAVVLMVAFLLPAGFQQGGGPGDEPVAFLGDRPITADEFRAARQDWDVLTQYASTNLRGAGEQDVPLAILLGRPTDDQVMAAAYGQRMPGVGPLPASLVGNFETFLLLLREAEAAGVVVTAQQVDDAIVRENARLRPGVPKGIDTKALERAVRSLLMVNASYDRVAQLAKASAPMRDRELAARTIELTADVVTIDAAPAGIPTTAFVGTTAPSDDELAAHFEKYADVAPGTPTADDPFGFGYRVPDRAKVQTITLGRAQLRSAVDASKTPREWEVLARRYYLENEFEFPSPQPPATETTTQPAAPSTAPAFQPFDQVKAQVMDRVTGPEVDALAARVTAFLSDRLARDYAAAAPSTRPATAPAAAGAYGSYAYLEEVARDVQKQFGVLPTVNDRADWLTREQAAAMPGIGAARAGTTGTPFGAALFAAQPFAGADGAASPGGVRSLRLLEFSAPLTESTGDVHLFRLTAAEPAHPPAGLAEVRPAVAADVARRKAADAAQAAAKALVEDATKTGFAQAAAGRKVTVVGPIAIGARPPVTSLNIADADRVRFYEGLSQLLSSATRDPAGRPVGTITLPASKQVLVLNVTAATPSYDPADAYRAQLAIGGQLEGQLASVVQQDWFSFDGVSKRLDYKGDRPSPALAR